ncbi:hypothetical protein N431DRAFT_344728 [Stipitochalara longipes BDJ]|nr:hypothetical protein N431DRAFT_344728 [Stipitochalara longipes BDJ]
MVISPPPIPARPVMMIHRGWHSHADPHLPYEDVFRLDSDSSTSESTLEAEKKIHWPHKSKPVVQEFAFVNATTPFGNRDPDIRRLVRGHVVKDTTRRKKLKREKDGTREKAISARPQSRDGLFGDDLGLETTQSSVVPEAMTLVTLPKEYFSPFPYNELDPHPELSPIIHHITEMGYAMCPHLVSFKINPIGPTSWFDHALRDEALFHALLYTTTSYAGLMGGSTETKDSIIHFGKSVSLVKERLKSMCDIRNGNEVTILVEGTARAVSCLAFTEVIRGNVDGWKTHMMGLNQMVDVRGGITQFSIGLQLKLHRSVADLWGATEHLCHPYFSERNGLPTLPSREITQQSAQIPLLSFLDTLPISPNLLNSLIYMHFLSQRISSLSSGSTIYNESEQVSLMKDTFSLRYSLVPSPGSPPLDPENASLDDVLRIGAILYLQATPQEFPYAAVGPGNLVKKLRGLVFRVPMWNEMEAELMMWLLFIGTMCARKGPDRIWYVAQIGKLTARLGLSDWDIVKQKLEEFWWVGGLHEKAAREVWEEAEVLRSVMSVT